jgi:hypothetical protein
MFVPDIFSEEYTSGWTNPTRFPKARISEFELRSSAPGGSLELVGHPSASFSGTLLVIDSNSGGSPGRVITAEDLSGTFNSDGLLAVGVPTMLSTPSCTVVVVTSFTGTAGSTDIDADDDGVADGLSTIGTVYDAVGVPGSPGDEQFLYGSQLGGADFQHTGGDVKLVFRESSTGPLYALNDPPNGQVCAHARAHSKQTPSLQWGPGPNETSAWCRLVEAIFHSRFLARAMGR